MIAGRRRGGARREARGRLRARRSRSPGRASAPSSRWRRTRAGPSPPRSSATGRRVYRQRRRTTASAASRTAQTGYKIVDTAGLAVPPDRRRRGRHQPLSPLRQLVPERHVPRRPVTARASRTPTISQLAVRLPSRTRSAILYIGLGGGSAPKRMWRDFPERAGRRGRARPRGRRRRPTSSSSCRATRGCDVEVEDGRRFSRPNDGPWDVIVDRRVLLRLDPVPPRDAGVPRARPLAARARRPRRHEHHRRRERPRLAPLPLDASHLPRGLPDRRDPSRARQRRRRPRHRSGTSSSLQARAPRRRRSSCSSAGATLRRRSPGAPDLVDGDQAAASTYRPDEGRAGADGRLRADRRAAAPLRLGSVDGREPRRGTTREPRTRSTNALSAAGIEGFIEEARRAASRRPRALTSGSVSPVMKMKALAGALVRSQRGRKAEAVEHRHADVEQHEVDRLGARELESFLPVRGLEHVVAVALQDSRAQSPDRGVDRRRRARAAGREGGRFPPGSGLSGSIDPFTLNLQSRRERPTLCPVAEGGSRREPVSCGPRDALPRAAAAAPAISA